MNLSRCCNAEIIKTEADENPSLYQCSGCGDMHRLRSLIEQDEPTPPTSTEVEEIETFKHMLTVVMTMVSSKPDDREAWKEAWEYGTSWEDEVQPHLIQQAELRGRIDELSFIQKSNKGNGIQFLTGSKTNNGWESIPEYASRKIAELQAQLDQLGGSDD